MAADWLAIADLHYSSDPDDWWLKFGQREFRRYSTATTRLQPAIDQANSDVVDFFIQLADVVNMTNRGSTYLAQLQNYIDDVTNGITGLTRDRYDVIGNHWSGKPSEAEFFTKINVGHAARSNPWPAAETPRAYTFEKNSIRFIVMFAAEGDPTINASQLSWLENTALDTSLPVVVFSHFHLHTDIMPFGDADQYASVGAANAAAVQAKLEAHGKVQGVIQGHYHRANSFTVINNIPYFSLFGSVLAFAAGDNAYYKFLLEPDVHTIGGQSIGHWTVTGYGSRAKSTSTKLVLGAA